MRYQNYKAKMLKIRKIMDFCYRFRFVFAGVAAATIATVVTLDVTKGNITKTSKFEISYNYGESISYSGESFMGDVSFEFRKVGEESWSEETPRYVGEYEARAKSKGNHGYKYSPVTTFEILPIEAKFVVDEDIIAFGNHKPSLDYTLLSGDHLEEYNVSYTDLTKNKTNAKVDLSSIKILDKDNIDVTSCYALSTEEKEITFQKEKINIIFKNVVKNYDGEEESGDEYDLTGTLYYGGQITFEKHDNVKDIGNYDYEHEVTIVGEDGKDYSANYDITVNKNSVKINKIPAIRVASKSLTKVYDGEKFAKEAFEIESIEGVLPIHHYEVTYTNMDKFEFTENADNTFNIVILDEKNNNVSSYYEDIIKTPGKINITKRPISIKSKDLKEAKFDNTDKFNEGYDIIAGSLVEGHDIKVTSYTKAKYYGSYDNEQTYEIIKKGDETTVYTSNYIINDETKGKIEIENKKLAFTFEKQEKDYNGQDQFIYANENHGTLTPETADNLPEGWTAEAFFPADKKMKDFKEDGYQLNHEEIIVIVRDKDDNIVYNDTDKNNPVGTNIYQKSDFSFGTMPVSRIKKIDLGISLPTEVFEKDFDNKRLADDASFDLNVLATKTGLIKGEGFEDTLLLDFKNAEDKDIKEVKIEGDSVVSYNVKVSYKVENQDGKDVTNNYNEPTWTGEKDSVDVKIKKIPIELKVDDLSKVYDGNNKVEPKVSITGTYSGLGGETIELADKDYTVDNANVGTHPFNVEPTDITIKKGGVDVTKNYQITNVIPVDATITARPVSIKQTDNTKTKIYYDKANHGIFNGSKEITIQSQTENAGLLSDHDLIINTPAFRSTVGEEDFAGTASTFGIQILKGTDDVTSNYSVSVETVHVNIVKKVVSFTFPSKTQKYDGSIYDPFPDQNGGTFYDASTFGISVSVTAGGSPDSLFAGDVVKVTKPANLSDTIHAGVYTNDISFKVERSGNNVSDLYDFNISYGNITISKASVTLSTTAFNSKVYDGQVITNGPSTSGPFPVTRYSSQSGAYISSVSAGPNFNSNFSFTATATCLTPGPYFMAKTYEYDISYSYNLPAECILGSDITISENNGYIYQINTRSIGIMAIPIDGTYEIRKIISGSLAPGDVLTFGGEPLENGVMTTYTNPVSSATITRGSDDVTSCYNISY